MRNPDVEKDDTIRTLVEQHFSIRFIKQVLHVSQDRIERARDSPRGTTVVGKSGRSPKVTPEIRALVEAETRQDGSVPDEVLAHKVSDLTGVTLSHDTIRRVRQDLGFRYRPRMVVQELSEEQKLQRREFCRWILQQDELDFSKIVFSDESRICEGPDRSWCYIRRGEWNENVMAAKEKFTKSVMVFGAIGSSFKSKLVICQESVNSAAYVSNLEKCGVIPEMNSRYGEFKWLLMQDGAPSHTSRETMDWLRRRINILPGWPPNSPDLNPIEMLWAILKKKRHHIEESTLEAQVCSAWDSITEETINSLVDSFRYRCEMVLAVDGESISQYLSSHKKTDRRLDDDDLRRKEYPEELDDAMMSLLEQPGVSWSDASRKLRQIAPDLRLRFIRGRWKVLLERLTMERNLHRLPGIHSIPWSGPDEDEVWSDILVNVSISRYMITYELRELGQ